MGADDEPIAIMDRLGIAYGSVMEALLANTERLFPKLSSNRKRRGLSRTATQVIGDFRLIHRTSDGIIVLIFRH